MVRPSLRAPSLSVAAFSFALFGAALSGCSGGSDSPKPDAAVSSDVHAGPAADGGSRSDTGAVDGPSSGLPDTAATSLDASLGDAKPADAAVSDASIVDSASADHASDAARSEAGAGIDGANPTGGVDGKAGAGGAGGTGGTSSTRSDDIPGPVTPDEPPVVVDSAQLVSITPPIWGSLSEDGAGNIYIIGTESHAALPPCGGPGQCPPFVNEVAALGPDLGQKWVHKFSPAQQAVVVRSNGEAYFGSGTTAALPGETQVGSSDATLGKLDATGQVVWQHQWGGTGSQQTLSVGIEPDGAVIGLGVCSGQVPGNPPDNKGGPFAVRYEADGTRTWLKQYPTTLGIPLNELVDSAGNVYFGSSGPTITTLNPVDGSSSQGPNYTSVAGGFPQARFALDFKSFYASSGNVIGQLGLDGNALWYRQGGSQTAVIDTVEGVKWTGTISTIATAFGLATEGIYVFGTYTNTYQNGSVARPSTTPVYVARLGRSGEQVWFKELLLQGTANKSNGNPLGLAVHDPAVVVAFFWDNAGTYAVRLSKADGSLL
jgi:hypothetical protein